ncbi:MAG: flagellar brake protein [Clostridium sp.]|nr:flagellar brake protein [Clostridium sp.]
MLSEYVFPGNKLEIRAADQGEYIEEIEKKKKVYHSQVYDIVSDDRLEVLLPMEKSRLISLPVNMEYDLYFFTPSGLYRCHANALDVYKSNKNFVLLFETTEELRKFQRREFYRLECAVEMFTRPLENEEISAVVRNDDFLAKKLPLKRGTIVDISGGGIRFVGSFNYQPGDLIYCQYNLGTEDKPKIYMLVAKVLYIKEVEDRPDVLEYRAQYINMDTVEREEIIRFIFDEERKRRKRKKGL